MLRSRRVLFFALKSCWLLVAGAFALLPVSTLGAQPFVLLKLDGAYLKWGEPTLGTGATVRYAFVTEPTDFAGSRNCERMVPLDPFLKRQGIAANDLQRETRAAFAMWEEAANLRFEPAASLAEADILIGGLASGRGRAFANVRYRERDEGGTRSIEQSLICLNPLMPWKIGFGGDPAAYDLRYTIAHEIGHAIGLNHPGASGQLMGFRYSEDFREPQPGDLQGAIALYGSRDGKATAAVPVPPVRRPAEMGLR